MVIKTGGWRGVMANEARRRICEWHGKMEGEKGKGLMPRALVYSTCRMGERQQLAGWLERRSLEG